MTALDRVLRRIGEVLWIRLPEQVQRLSLTLSVTLRCGRGQDRSRSRHAPAHPSPPARRPCAEHRGTD